MTDSRRVAGHALACGVVLLVAAAPLATVRGQDVPRTGAGAPAALPLPDRAPQTLTIEQAVALARRNNPDYLAQRSNRRTAAAAVRAARGGLLPQMNASLTSLYQQGGQQFFSGVALRASSDVMQSSYNVGLSYPLNAGRFIAPRVERANAAAVDADIVGAGENLAANVRQAYLTVLGDAAKLSLADTLVANASVQLDLAQARAAVGSGTMLDVQRAEVALGQQQVARLQAENQLDVDRLRLFQLMGVPQPSTVRLASKFAVGSPLPPLDTLVALAERQNPGVVALRARERAAGLGVARQRTEYTPTLTLSTGVGGYTYSYRDPSFVVSQARAQTEAARASCIAQQEVRAAVNLPNTLGQCNAIAFTDAQAAAIRANNSAFPFGFNRAPRSVAAVISLPVFDGFAREQRRQQALVAADAARYSVRSRELALTADVTAAYLSLQAAAKTVALQDQNAAKAKQELRFVQDQYAVGLATFVDLTTSRTAYAQAETDRINATYNYHKAFATLESAVGRPLR